MRSALAAALLIAVASADVARALAADIVATPATIRDFLIQNVCLDRRGVVLVGVSPADANPGCVDQRDLPPGERLPSPTHDHPNQGGGGLLGYHSPGWIPDATPGTGNGGWWRAVAEVRAAMAPGWTCLSSPSAGGAASAGGGRRASAAAASSAAPRWRRPPTVSPRPAGAARLRRRRAQRWSWSIAANG